VFFSLVVFQAGVAITKVDWHGDFLVIRNSTLNSVSLDDWSVVTREGKQSFSFPSTFELESGAAVTLWIGSQFANKNNDETDLVWNADNIFNESGDGAHLVDPQGKTVSKIEVLPKHD
jgi:hypothetical protein